VDSQEQPRTGVGYAPLPGDPAPARVGPTCSGAGGCPGNFGAGPGAFDLDGAVKITPPDPAAALERLRWFVVRRVDGYARARNFLATDGTSRLSPYLRFGLVSPRQVAVAVARVPVRSRLPRASRDRGGAGRGRGLGLPGS
jgi:hypothetical protein